MADKHMEFQAYLDGMNAITLQIPLIVDLDDEIEFTLYNKLGEAKLEIKDRLTEEGFHKLKCGFNGDYLFGTEHWVISSCGIKAEVQIREVVRTAEFDRHFYYSGNDLGAACKDGKTTFNLWAPTATMVKLKLFSPGSKFFELIKMGRMEKGVWSVEMDRELEGFRYTYMISIDQNWREAVDPYAVAVTANGMQGVVAKLENTYVQRIDLPPFSHPADAVIYETHIRDFTINPASGAKSRGLYTGAAETDTIGPDGKPTGISYVKDLGITHIEFLPFNDFAGVDEIEGVGEYNWGYNPLNFNAPEGSFSSDPADPYVRIRELKAMIEAIHSHGMRVIMDVVYNHVYIREKSSFEKIVPGYYFRYDDAGKPSDGTGVGNDIASERLMARKFILDSIRFWVEEYNIDGFRFDLMGILDVKTVNEVRAVCDSIKPGMLIIGEGWELNTPLPQGEKATIRNQNRLPEIGQFNDRFRDCIKGSTFNLYERGYALGNGTYTEQAKEAIAGSIGFQFGTGLFSEPGQSVNYVEAHDNHTLWDKLEACLGDSGELLKMKCHRLATSLVLLSQGIPFLHSGQEFFRTKGGEGNSYKSPDSVNMLDWERKASFPENVRYIKGIIEIRQEYPCFRMRTASRIKADMKDMGLNHPLVGLSYQNKSHNNEVLLLVNPSAFIHHIQLPPGDWEVIADDIQAGTVPLRVIQNGEKAVSEPVSLMVLVKK